MSSLAASPAKWRAPRVSLGDMTPAVLRLQDGSGARGTLKTLSLTGGLLTLSNALDRGARVKLMFMTRTGPVLGTAEMLNPISTGQQPFRFVALEEGDQRRLRTVVQSCLDPVDDAWIAKYRAAVSNQRPARRGFLRAALRALTIITLVVGSAIFLLHVYPWK